MRMMEKEITLIGCDKDKKESTGKVCLKKEALRRIFIKLKNLLR